MATLQYNAGVYDFSYYDQSVYAKDKIVPTYRIDGFTYNGIHCSKFGVYYIPNETGRGDFFSPYEVISSERSWFDGGSYYSSRIKSRVFELDCYYEEIDYKTREKLIRWLDRRTHGKLIFDARPYAEYYVYPSEAPKVKDYKQGNLYSGLFTVKFTAFDPFAQLTCDRLEDDVTGIAELEAYLLPSAVMPSDINKDTSNGLIYNPGTEKGHSIIRFKGNTGSGDLTIYNSTTGNTCVLKNGLNTGTGYVELDSKTGRMKKVVDNTEETYFAYHDKGYITFDPNEIIYSNVKVKTTAGSRYVTSTDIDIDESLIGNYIYVDGNWNYIGGIVNGRIQMSTTASKTATISTYIASMNQISITKATDANIVSLEIICKPEVR